MKAYKLTDEKFQTRNQTQWGENITHEATGDRTELCTDGFIHFYTDPLIAVFVNSIHVDFEHPVLWECETGGKHLHEPLKSGCKKLTTLKQIPLPKVTTVQRIAFGLLCVKEVYKNSKWNKWANKWLSGEDRSKESAKNAVDVAYYDVADSKSADAAYAASFNTSIHNVYSADAANDVAKIDSSIDFVKIAKKALKY